MVKRAFLDNQGRRRILPWGFQSGRRFGSSLSDGQ